MDRLSVFGHKRGENPTLVLCTIFHSTRTALIASSACPASPAPPDLFFAVYIDRRANMQILSLLTLASPNS